MDKDIVRRHIVAGPSGVLDVVVRLLDFRSGLVDVHRARLRVEFIDSSGRLRESRYLHRAERR